MESSKHFYVKRNLNQTNLQSDKFSLLIIDIKNIAEEAVSVECLDNCIKQLVNLKPIPNETILDVYRNL
jgi:hypothetical protein